MWGCSLELGVWAFVQFADRYGLGLAIQSVGSSERRNDSNPKLQPAASKLAVFKERDEF